MLGGGMGGLLAWSAAVIPTGSALAAFVGIFLLWLSARVVWLGVVLLFIVPNVLFGSFTIPGEWRIGLLVFCLLLLILLLWMRRREDRSVDGVYTTPLRLWIAVVAFSVIPARWYGLSVEEWHYDALPLILPALTFVIPRRFIERRQLSRFLVIILLLALPMLWDFTIEYLQFQRLYVPADRVQEFRALGLGPLKEVVDRGSGRDFGIFAWQLEGLAVWQFFVLLTLALSERSAVRRALFGFLAALTFLMIFLWMRRTGLAALLLGGGVVVALLFQISGWKSCRRIARVGLVIGVVLAAGLIGLNGSGINTEKLLAGYGLAYARNASDPSFQWRLQEYEFVYPAFRESPWVGHGFGYVTPGLRWMYAREEAGDPGPYLLNFGSNLLVKTGVIGLCVFIWFLAATGWTLLRAFWTITDPFYNSLVLAAIGTLATLTFRSPLDDVFVAHLSEYPLSIALAIATYSQTKSEEL